MLCAWAGVSLTTASLVRLRGGMRNGARCRPAPGWIADPKRRALTRWVINIHAAWGRPSRLRLRPLCPVPQALVLRAGRFSLIGAGWWGKGVFAAASSAASGPGQAEIKQAVEDAKDDA
jgi:hypothetical protein